MLLTIRHPVLHSALGDSTGALWRRKQQVCRAALVQIVLSDEASVAGVQVGVGRQGQVLSAMSLAAPVAHLKHVGGRAGRMG